MPSGRGDGAHDRVRPVYRDTNLHIIFGVTLIAVLGVSSITPAFPSVVEALGIEPQQVGLLITFFTLPGVALTPVLGVLADRWGRKRILIPSLLLFGVAGLACGFAHSFPLLLCLRFLQGVGAASLGSLNVTIIGDLYSGPERPAAMGVNASVLSIGTAAYPAIGGALATLGWFYPFFLAAFAVPVGIWALHGLKNPEPRSEQGISTYVGNTLRSLADVRVLGLFLAGVVTFIILYGAYLTYLPVFISTSFEGSPFVIGLILSSMSLSTAATSSQLGRLTRRFSGKTLLLTASAFYGLALIILPFMPGLWWLLIPAVIFGVGHGLNVPSLHTLLTGLAPMEHRAAFMSVNGMLLRLGQTLGPVIMGAVFAVHGIRATFYAGTAFALVMMIVLCLLLPQGSLSARGPRG